MSSEDLAGSPFVAFPLEKHVFKGGDFECSTCGRPRAMHLNDGFVPGKGGQSFLSFDPKARYGRHPYFWKPKTVRLDKSEQAQLDWVLSRRKKV